jgi:hypothetical protein
MLAFALLAAALRSACGARCGERLVVSSELRSDTGTRARCREGRRLVGASLAIDGLSLRHRGPMCLRDARRLKRKWLRRSDGLRTVRRRVANSRNKRVRDDDHVLEQLGQRRASGIHSRARDRQSVDGRDPVRYRRGSQAADVQWGGIARASPLLCGATAGNHSHAPTRSTQPKSAQLHQHSRRPRQ